MTSQQSSVGLTNAERRIVYLVSVIQFVNILDFMMVMPMGPDFALALGIPTDRIGYVGGAYTAAAFFSAFAGALYLDRLDRRTGLAIAMTGLVLSTALGGLATDLHSLIFARLLAGLFGGPASSLSLAIIADSVPPERRGRAMGMVGASFSAAAVFGVPIGLELAKLGGWRTPFFTIAALGLLVVFAAIRIMKPQRSHMEGRPPFELRTQIATLGALFKRNTTKLALSATTLGLFGNFLLIPNLSTYFQFNLGYPRQDLSWLYACGGFVSFFSMRYAGRLVDRFGGFKVITGLSTVLIAVYYTLFLHYNPVLPVLLLFTIFMTINGARFVVINATNTKVPPPQQRAAFMSLVAMAQHLGSSTAAFTASLLLVARSDQSLDHIPEVAWLSVGVALLVPGLIYLLEKTLSVPPYRNEATVMPYTRVDRLRK